MNERSNLKRHQHCPMRTHVGNCLIIGGFCTSIREDICDALHKSFKVGTRSRAVDKANDDAISREYIVKKLKSSKEVYLSAWEGFSNMDDKDKARCDELNNCIATVINAPSVVPSRAEGEWILECDAEGEGDNLYRCSECGRNCGCQEYDLPNFCYHCGADMRGEAE